jgi:Zn-dependent peptidase ImmA (M78 family)
MCDTWRDRLRLNDWLVDIAYGTKEEMEGCLGSTAYDARHQVAHILVARNHESPAEVEHTVVHELLHLLLHGHREPKSEDIMLERGINLVATALLAAAGRP